MNRIFLVIGSKDYTSNELQELAGCEPDAVNIFDALVDPEIGGYDKEKSVCLISPSLEQVRRSLDLILATNDDIDVLTFAFSGHGGVKTGNLYLCLKDTDIKRLSTTALSLSQLFSFLAEISPKQSNIIIDACESGGVVADLRQLINPDLLGAANTPGVSIFAAAASDQSAKETAEGGHASTALIRCLRGLERVQTNRPYLNLVEVGNFVSAIVSTTADNQTPVVWGLNLFGDSFLSKNPHFEGDMPPYSYGLARIPAGSGIGKILQRESHGLWREYLNLPEHLDTRHLVNAICKPCEKIGREKGVVSSFVRGLSQSLPSRAAQQGDLFAEVQVHASCIVALLPYLDVDEEAEYTILELTKQICSSLQRALERTYDTLTQDHYALLSNRGGASDLYVLPIRISKLFGWAAANAYMSAALEVNERDSNGVLEMIVRFAIDNYINSVVAMSDCQAPFLLCCFSQLHRMNCNEALEIVFGSVFNNYIQNRGLVADAKISSSKIPEFLLRRASNNSTGAHYMYARPDELLSVMFHTADKAKFEDVVDPYLEKIDHHILNVFIPSDHRAFGAESIRNGVNTTFQIGYEGGLGVFRTCDFREGWEKSCVPLLNGEPRKESIALKVAVLLASFLFPDRVPWLAIHAQ